MMSKKSSLVFGAVVTIFSFFMIMWVSCSKPGQPKSCDNFICKNGGYCYLDTLYQIQHCACPAGYEGDRCEVPSVNKYVGNWQISTLVEESDSPSHTGQTDSYVILLSKSATPTTFFFNHFRNSDYYNEIICNMDSINSHTFAMDTMSNYHMQFDHYQIRWGNGKIFGNDSIVGSFYIRFKNGSSNWEKNKVHYKMVPYGR